MSKTKIKIVFLILITAVLTGFACKTTANAVEPEEKIIPAGSRNYTWYVDTIKVPKGYDLFPVRMWAASPTDVWAVGPAYSVRHMIWRFDGISWKTDSVLRNIWSNAVWGASKNDVWIGNMDGTIWHYNGTAITKFCDTKIDSCGAFIMEDIYGSSATDVYAVGFAQKLNSTDYKGVIMHYDGQRWEDVKLPYVKKSFSGIRYDITSKQYVIAGHELDNSKETGYSFNGKNITELVNTTYGCSVNNVGSRVFYNVGPKMYIYEDSKLKLLKDFTGTNYLGRIWGRSENDYFTNNQDGIGHYNGTDLVTLWKKWNIDIVINVGILIDNDIFFIWRNTLTGETYSVHGVLNK